MRLVYFSGKPDLLAPLAGLSLLLLAAGCSNATSETSKQAAKAPQAAVSSPAAPADDAAALQEAVIAYVRDVKGLDTSKMDVVMKNPAVTGTTAQATVDFKIKESEMAPMTYQYAFEKSGEAWKVVSSKPASGEGHGAIPMQPMPEGHPPVSGQPAETGAPGMASGHSAPPAPAAH